MTQKKSNQKQQKGYIVLDSADRTKAGRRLQDEGLRSLAEARMNLEAGLYPESMSASRFAMEKFAKCILALSLGRYPTKHHIPSDDAEAALKEIGDHSSAIWAQFLPKVCARALILSNMWATAYIPISHGFQRALLSPKELFETRDAERALEDAERCSNIVAMLLARGDELKVIQEPEGAEQ